jgi:hypothetical protein
MRVADMLAAWEKGTDRAQTWIDADALYQELGIQGGYWWIEMDDPLQKYWVSGYTWVCTDTMVGVAVYTLGDQIVGISFQSARKSTEEFYWATAASCEQVREYLLSKVQAVEDAPRLIQWEQNVDAWQVVSA